MGLQRHSYPSAPEARSQLLELSHHVLAVEGVNAVSEGIRADSIRLDFKAAELFDLCFQFLQRDQLVNRYKYDCHKVANRQ